jgi:HPt (histidine-containing phosphotransfer) domain-containing protein
VTIGEPIVSRLATGDPRFRAIVEEFIDQLDAHMEAIEYAWNERDYEALRNRAHYLKGAGGSVGFDEFTEPSAHLEQLAKAEQEDGVEEAIALLRDLALRVVVEAPEIEPMPKYLLPEKAVDRLPTTPIFSTLKTSDPRFKAIVEEFIEQLDGRMAAIENAWAERDYEALRSEAHYLKGAGGSVGFDEFTEPSAYLEQLAKIRDQLEVEETIAELRNLASRVAVNEIDSQPKMAAN